jgi:predicted lipid-binding transport protein (Tim44 family)
MNGLQKFCVFFFGFQIVMLALMTFLSELHGHSILQILSLALVAYGATKFYKARTRVSANANAHAASNANSPAANAAPAQPAASAPATTNGPTPVYYKSAVVKLKNQP